MTQENIAAAYRQSSARGSSPVGLVVKLYDAILEDFRRAIQAIQSGDVEARTGLMNHALQIVAELQNSLNHQQGGQVAQRLEGFYKVTRGLILEASVVGSREKIDRLIGLYSPIRQAWQQAEKELAAGKNSVSSEPTKPMATPPSPAFPGPAAFETEVSHSRWNA